MKLAIGFGLVLILGCQNEPATNRPIADTAAVKPLTTSADSVNADAQGVLVQALQGAWGRKDENFAWSIEGDSILFESDMMRYPFEVHADTVIIHRDESIGIQKTRILLLAADSMIIQDVLSETAETLFRLR